MKNAGRKLMWLSPLYMLIFFQIISRMIPLSYLSLFYGSETAIQIYGNNFISIVLIADMICLIAGIIWYRAVFPSKKESEEEVPFSLFDSVLIWGSVLGLQCLISTILKIWSFWSPDTIQSYYETIYAFGIVNNKDPLAVLTGLVVAPVEEELIFRGLTLSYLKRTGAGFWGINMIQAAFFAFMYMNLVQSIYTFLIGLVFGYLVMRYHSLWAGIQAHILFNGYYYMIMFLENADIQTQGLLWRAAGIIAGCIGIFFILCRIREATRTKRKRQVSYRRNDSIQRRR